MDMDNKLQLGGSITLHFNANVCFRNLDYVF